MSPVTTHLTPLQYILLEYMVPKMYDLIISFRIMIGVPLVLTTGILILQKSLIELTEAPLRTDPQ